MRKHNNGALPDLNKQSDLSSFIKESLPPPVNELVFKIKASICSFLTYITGIVTLNDRNSFVIHPSQHFTARKHE